VEPTRLAYLVIGVALTAIATAVAGPITFVALAAPQLAQRLTRTPGIALVPSAAMGAFLLMISDFLAQRAFAPTQVPVGIVTVSVGGIYFVWLLVRQARR
jgi:iron-siderophore transport system permease protein